MTTCVYIAGPLSGNLLANAGKAMDIGEELRRLGFAVYVPHMMIFWPHPVEYEAWIAHDLAWLSRCDLLLRLPGESPGATREEAFAVQHGIPVFHSMPELVAWQSARVVLDA